MRKGTLLILTLSLAFASSAWAGPRSWQQAKAIAEQQAAKLGITLDEDATSNAKANGQSSTATNASYYVFANSDSKGYIIVSGDDVMPEIVGYSTNGTYDESQLPANYAAFLKAYDATVKAVQKGDRIAISNVEQAKRLRAEKTFTAVAPLLEKDGINWDQNKPYNLKCPTYKDKAGNVYQCATGCTATAMAQIMRYYKYPAATTAEIPSYTYTSESGAKETMAAIPAGTTFDWDNMLGTYKGVSYTEEQGNAVAQLMLACGCSKQMSYGVSSGTGLYAAAQFATYFGYNPNTIQDVDRAAFTLEQWTDLIDTELANARPILYMGTSFTAGHAFVCDGSDGNGLYHINWGWSGYQNNYFDITILNPEKGGIGSGNDTDGYTRSNSMTIGITSDQSLKPEEPLANYAPISIANYYNNTGIEAASFVLLSNKRNSASDTFKAQINSCFYVNHGDNFTGSVGYGIKNNDGTYTCLVEAALENCTVYKGTAFSKEFSYAFPVGETTLYPIYKKEGENTWKRCVAIDIVPVMVTANETEAVASSAIQAELTLDTDLYSKVPSKATINLTSHLDEDFYGSAIMYVQSTVNEKVYNIAGNLDITLPANEKKTVTVNVIPKFSGNAVIGIIDNDFNSIYTEDKVWTIKASETPQFKLVAVETNAEKEETAEINALFNFGQVTMVVPKIKHDQITVTYSIQNNASTPGALSYGIAAQNTSTYEYKQVTQDVRAEGNGAITKVSATFSSEDIGKEVCVLLKAVNASTNKYEYLATDLEANKYTYTTDTSTSPSILTSENPAVIYAYIAGESTGISATTTESGSYVAGGKGIIVVKAAESKTIGIYNLSGQKVTELSLNAGEQQTVSVRPGIYIVDGTKIAVK